MSGPLTDEQIAAIAHRPIDSTPGGRWQTAFDRQALLAEVERLKAERDEQAARMESAEQAFIDMAQNNGGFDACATLSHVTRIMSALRGAETPHRVAYNQLHNEIARLKDGLVALIRAWRAHDDDTGDYGRCADEAEGLLNGGAWC